MSRRGWILFLALSIIWGLPYLMIRVAVRQLDPATLVFARTLPAAVVLIPWALRQGAFSSLRGSWRWLFAFSVLEFGVPWFLMGSAERHLSSSLTGLMVACVPLFAIVFHKILHRGEPVSKRRVLGLLVGSMGVVILVGLDIRGSSWVWTLCMGLVVLGYASGPMILGLRLNHASGLAVVGAGVGFVALLSTPWGLTHWPAQVSGQTWLCVAGLSVLCTAGGLLIFFALIQEIGPSRSVVVTYLNTAVAVLLGTVVLGEALTTGILIGFPLIILGSVLATTLTRTQRS